MMKKNSTNHVQNSKCCLSFRFKREAKSASGKRLRYSAIWMAILREKKSNMGYYSVSLAKALLMPVSFAYEGMPNCLQFSMTSSSWTKFPQQNLPTNFNENQRQTS